MQVNANVGAQLRDETRFQSSPGAAPGVLCALGNLRQGGQVSTEDAVLKKYQQKAEQKRGRERGRERTVINHEKTKPNKVLEFIYFYSKI